MNTPVRVMVPVKSAWYSKINWAQAPGFLVGAIAFFSGGAVSPEMLANTLAGFLMVQSFVTWVLKTYFTSTVTPGSVETKGGA